MRKVISACRSRITVSLAVINLLGLLAVFRSLCCGDLGARF